MAQPPSSLVLLVSGGGGDRIRSIVFLSHPPAHPLHLYPPTPAPSVAGSWVVQVPPMALAQPSGLPDRRRISYGIMEKVDSVISEGWLAKLSSFSHNKCISYIFTCFKIRSSDKKTKISSLSLNGLGELTRAIHNLEQGTTSDAY